MAERFYVNCELKPGPVRSPGRRGASSRRGLPPPRRRRRLPVQRRRPAIPRAHRGSRPPRASTLEVFAVESPCRELPFRLEVAAPLPRGDRAQFLLEKLTELGVTSFTPLQTARSVVHPRETKLDKLQRHVIEASKQCGRNVLLQVRPMVEWSAFCRSAELPAARMLGHPGGESKRDADDAGAIRWWRSVPRADSRMRRSPWRARRAGACWIWGRASCASRQRRSRWRCCWDEQSWGRGAGRQCLCTCSAWPMSANPRIALTIRGEVHGCGSP